MIRRKLALPVVVVTALALAACGEEPTAPDDPDLSASQQGQADVLGASAQDTMIPNQFIVVFRGEVSAPVDLAEKLAAEHGIEIRHTYEHAIKGFSGVFPEGARVAVEQNPNVDYVEQNQYMFIDTHPAVNGGVSRDVREEVARSQAESAHNFRLAMAGAVPPDPPAAPTNLTATATGQSSIDLAWTNGEKGITGTQIERCEGAGCTGFTQIASVGKKVESYSDTGLSSGTTYRYRVRHFKDRGNNRDLSAYSNVADATTDAGEQPPAAPSNLTATPTSSSSIDLDWTDNSGNEDGFSIERCQGSGCTDFAEIDQTGPDVTSYTDTGLSANTTYTYRVRAFNGAGNSDYSNTADATTEQEATSPPADPSSLSATAASSSSIDLDWTDNSDNEDGFYVERCQGDTGTCGDADYSRIDETGANVTSYTDTGLSSNTTYSYRVQAFNSAGASGYTNEAQATTDEASTGDCTGADPGGHDDLTDLWGIRRVSAPDNVKWQHAKEPGCELTVDFFGLDTGVDSDHPDLNVVEIQGFVSGETGEDGNGHGTHTAGTVAAIDGNGGVVGVAPGAPVHGYQVCDDGGSCPIDAIIAGVDEVTAQKNASPSQPMVANMSLGGGTNTSLDQAVRESVAAGVVYSISAGNGQFGACFFPADAQNFSPARVGDDDITSSGGSNGDTQRANGAVTTTSSTESDAEAGCNYGNPVTVAAPGVGILSTYLNGGYETLSGTSMAAPHSGGAAILYLHEFRDATPTAVEQAIMDDLDPWSPTNTPNADGILNVSGL